MARIEGDYLVAETRGEALNFGDRLKAEISLAMQHNTPVVCLACQHSSPMGDSCNEGYDMDQVRHDEMAGETSAPETLLTEICSGFESNRVLPREQ